MLHCAHMDMPIGCCKLDSCAASSRSSLDQAKCTQNILHAWKVAYLRVIVVGCRPRAALLLMECNDVVCYVSFRGRQCESEIDMGM